MTLHELIAFNAHGLYLEIGVCEGGSLLAALSSGKVPFAVGIDTWGDNYGGTNRGSPDHVLIKLGSLAHAAMLITGDSKKVLPQLRAQFDTIFVDGDHSSEGALADLSLSLPLLHPDGTLLFDDVDHPTHHYLRRVVTGFAAAHDLRIIFHSVHMGVAELRRKHAKS